MEFSTLLNMVSTLSFTLEPKMWAWYIFIALLSLRFVLWGIARGKHKVQAKPAEKKTSNRTWRLFITPEHGMESTPVISDADLRTAIGKKFRVDLNGTRLVLVREPERYCATLSLKYESLPFVDGRPFTVDVLQEEGRKISARYECFQCYTVQPRSFNYPLQYYAGQGVSRYDYPL